MQLHEWYSLLIFWVIWKKKSTGKLFFITKVFFKIYKPLKRYFFHFHNYDFPNFKITFAKWKNNPFSWQICKDLIELYHTTKFYQNFTGNFDSIMEVLWIFFAFYICGALRDLVPLVQFRKREKHPWRSVNFSKVAKWR